MTKKKTTNQQMNALIRGQLAGDDQPAGQHLPVQGDKPDNRPADQRLNAKMNDWIRQRAGIGVQQSIDEQRPAPARPTRSNAGNGTGPQEPRRMGINEWFQAARRGGNRTFTVKISSKRSNRNV